MKKNIMLLLFLPILGLSGCPKRIVIAIKVIPQDNASFSRSISVNNKERNLIQEMEKVYQQPISKSDKMVTFQAKFRQLPSDITFGNNKNRGEYTTLHALLGTVKYYRESFPSRMTPYQDFQYVIHYFDTWIDGIAKIAGEELKDEKGIEQLVSFLQKDFKGDVHDMLFMLNSFAIAAVALDYQQDKIPENNIFRWSELREIYIAQYLENPECIIWGLKHPIPQDIGRYLEQGYLIHGKEYEPENLELVFLWSRLQDEKKLEQKIPRPVYGRQYFFTAYIVAWYYCLQNQNDKAASLNAKMNIFGEFGEWGIEVPKLHLEELKKRVERK